MIRLSLDTIDSSTESYLDQMLFHLIQDGEGNRLVNACSKQQRKFVAAFLEYLVDNHGPHIEAGVFSTDDILRAYEIWASQHEIKVDCATRLLIVTSLHEGLVILLFAAA